MTRVSAAQLNFPIAAASPVIAKHKENAEFSRIAESATVVVAGKIPSGARPGVSGSVRGVPRRCPRECPGRGVRQSPGASGGVPRTGGSGGVPRTSGGAAVVFLINE